MSEPDSAVTCTDPCDPFGRAGITLPGTAVFTTESLCMLQGGRATCRGEPLDDGVVCYPPTWMKWAVLGIGILAVTYGSPRPRDDVAALAAMLAAAQCPRVDGDCDTGIHDVY